MRKLMLCGILLGFASGATAEERAFNPCAWTVQAKVMHMNNESLTTPMTAPEMSWTIKGVTFLVGSASEASDMAEQFAAKGVWTSLSPTPTSQRAVLYPPHMIQSVLIQGPADPRCDPAVTLRETPAQGRRER